MTTETILTPEQIDILLEGVLRASGSSLSNYTMRMGVEQMRGAIRAIEQAVLQSPEVQALTEWKEWPLEMPPLTSAPVLAFNRHAKEAEIVYGSLLDEVDDYSHWIPLPPPPAK